MNVDAEIALFFVAQSIIILGSMVTAFVKLKIGLAEVRADIGYVKENTATLKEDHRVLLAKVDGISEHVATIEGKIA